ncbi:Hpt domain-containing protein [Gimibacter soli]|uniref:Hpt domain-containing protein n=1 Tax=Gimibacter soli TaxID=3024400 RepID=A0AAE9XMU5_9PROT|nr:Hpt domain-containing protein [Gimibacter soli]WCL53081.1 Hpt domain-containing protein [Gimibacter soli]
MTIARSNWDESVILDRAHLAGFTGGDEDLEAEILGIFAANAPNYLETLKTAAVADWKAHAHKLKGAARGIGAWRLAVEAERAETEMPERSDAERAACLAELTVRLDALLAEIRAVVAA